MGMSKRIHAVSPLAWVLALTVVVCALGCASILWVVLHSQSRVAALEQAAQRIEAGVCDQASPLLSFAMSTLTLEKLIYDLLSEIGWSKPKMGVLTSEQVTQLAEACLAEPGMVNGALQRIAASAQTAIDLSGRVGLADTTLTTKSELEERFDILNTALAAITELNTKIADEELQRGPLADLEQALDSDISRFFGLSIAAHETGQPLEIYQGGVLAGLPVLYGLPDDLPDLPALAEALDTAGGMIDAPSPEIVKEQVDQFVVQRHKIYSQIGDSNQKLDALQTELEKQELAVAESLSKLRIDLPRIAVAFVWSLQPRTPDNQVDQILRTLSVQIPDLSKYVDLKREWVLD